MVILGLKLNSFIFSLLDLTKAPELEMTTHNATGLNDITKPANLELSGLELSKPELINDSYNNQEVDNASKIGKSNF